MGAYWSGSIGWTAGGRNRLRNPADAGLCFRAPTCAKEPAKSLPRYVIFRPIRQINFDQTDARRPAPDLALMEELQDGAVKLNTAALRQLACRETFLPTRK